MKIKTLLVGLVSLGCLFSLQAATWTNGNNSWQSDDPANWAPAGANPHDVITIASNDDLCLQTGGGAYLMTGIIVNSGISGYITIWGQADNLTVGASGIVNNGLGLLIEIPFFTNAAQVWEIGAGVLTFSQEISIKNDVTVNMISTSSLVIDNGGLGGQAWTGNFNILGEVNATAVSVVGSSLNAQQIGQITINGAAVTQNGNYLVAVPEASTYALVLGGLALAGVIWRRRSA